MIWQPPVPPSKAASRRSRHMRYRRRHAVSIQFAAVSPIADRSACRRNSEPPRLRGRLATSTNRDRGALTRRRSSAAALQVIGGRIRRRGRRLASPAVIATPHAIETIRISTSRAERSLTSGGCIGKLNIAKARSSPPPYLAVHKSAMRPQFPKPGRIYVCDPSQRRHHRACRSRQDDPDRRAARAPPAPSAPARRWPSAPWIPTRSSRSAASPSSPR